MHPDIQKAIDTFKEVELNKLKLAEDEDNIVFDELNEKEAAELECLSNLSALLQRQAV